MSGSDRQGGHWNPCSELSDALGPSVFSTPRGDLRPVHLRTCRTPASIEDQVRICREECARGDGEVVKVYSDHAISGSSIFRPEYRKLLADAAGGAFGVVVAESLDRLSRDLADTATLHKRLSYLGIRLWTLAEGETGDLHVGLKGTMNALYLKNLAQIAARQRAAKAREREVWCLT